jgi:hypothetical protein
MARPDWSATMSSCAEGAAVWVPPGDHPDEAALDGAWVKASFADGETIGLGDKRVRFIDTPHGWDRGYELIFSFNAKGAGVRHHTSEQIGIIRLAG